MERLESITNLESKAWPRTYTAQWTVKEIDEHGQRTNNAAL